MTYESEGKIFEELIAKKSGAIQEKMSPLANHFEEILLRARTLANAVEASQEVANGEFLSQDRGEAKIEALALLHEIQNLAEEGKASALKLSALEKTLESLEAASLTDPRRQ